MTTVKVFLEGPSDKLSMEALFRPLIERRANDDVFIEFFSVPDSQNMGDNKRALIEKGAEKAANILRNNTKVVVVIVPDLYPRDKVFPHSECEQLEAGLRQLFSRLLEQKQVENRESCLNRFFVFCFKHELEALLLAVPELLRRRLNTTKLGMEWSADVESINHHNPPKTIIEQLYRTHGRRYKGTEEAPHILGQADYHQLAQACPQCFAPFVEFLESCGPA